MTFCSYFFSCEILFSEFLSILKTTQVQPDMFQDMIRILIQNCQSSGNEIEFDLPRLNRDNKMIR